MSQINTLDRRAEPPAPVFRRPILVCPSCGSRAIRTAGPFGDSPASCPRGHRGERRDFVRGGAR